MAKKVMVRARTSEEIKVKAEEILQQTGLKPSDAINIFYRQIILNNGLPFPVRIPDKDISQAFIKTDNLREMNKHKTFNEFIGKVEK